jgi:hypothetical protein
MGDKLGEKIGVRAKVGEGIEAKLGKVWKLSWVRGWELR